MEKRLRSSLKNSAEEFLSLATKSSAKSIKPTLKTLISHISPSSDLISTLALALHQSISRSIDSFKQLLQSNDAATTSPFNSPPTKRPRLQESDSNDVDTEISSKKELIVQSLEICSHVVFLCITHTKKPFPPQDMLPCAQALHDSLVLFESEKVLLAEIAKLCEEWWKEQLLGRETLISQSLPFLLSKSLTLGKKVDVHRVYALREAFSLFDFDDESIVDLKDLLLRCILEPLYLKVDEGRRFIAFLFGLSGQLVKEILRLIRSQIPFGRKSVLEGYADILFRAWKVAEGSLTEEIEDGFLQGLVEGAIYASSENLAASARRVLGGFVSQRTVAGVEKLLFRLTEPVIFRSLQVANSNVRKNTLHLLLDVFPLEDPDSTKEVKDALFDKQFFLLGRSLVDECPDVRVVAVEGSCRILYLFWEIIPSPTITRTITKIVDDMSRDVSTEVRLSTLNGIIYLRGNPQTHEILKVLIPRLGHLFLDSALAVRVAFMDLLLAMSDIQTFQFHKVVGLDALLSSLSDDKNIIAQKITRLLIPSYFPSNVSPQEACNRCITLIKRSPTGGARFCEFALTEGSSRSTLMELARVSVNLLVSPNDMNMNQTEGLLVALVNLCNTLVTESSYKASLKRLFSGKTLKQLLFAGATKHAQTAIFNIASIISPDDVSEIIKECMVQVRNCGGLSLNVEMQEEVRSVHKLIVSCGRFDEMFVPLTEILRVAASECRTKFTAASAQKSMPTMKQKKAKYSAKSKSAKRTKTNSQDDTANLQQHYAVASGAAWQIKDLLTSSGCRECLLKSPKLEVAFSALKLISGISIEHCMHLEYMDTSPILAFTALAVHANLYNVHLAQLSDVRSTKSNKSGSTRPLLKGNALENALNHLFGCTKKLFTESESVDLPHTHGCTPAVSGTCVCDKKFTLNMVKIVTEVLKFIVDAITLCPISESRGKCLQFASACVQVIIPTLRKHSQGLLQTNEELKESLLCLKSSFTYAVKLLNVVLKNPNDYNSDDSSSLPLLEAFSLANNLLNLVVTIESYFGSKNAICFIPVVKTWVLDLILALGSSQLMPDKDRDVSSSIYNNTCCYLPWLKVLGKLEVSAHSEHEGEDEKFSVFKDVIETIVRVLRRNPKVVDSVGVIFLTGVMVLLEKEEYGLVFGIVHFVCVKLVHRENGEWGELAFMLACLREVYSRIKSRINEATNEEEKQMLESAEMLIEPVLVESLHEDDAGLMQED